MSEGARTPIHAPIVAVTVLEDRASITRRGTFPLGAGQHRLILPGCAPVLVDNSLSAIASGARVTAIRCVRARAAWLDPAGASAEPVAALRAEHARLSAEQARARAQGSAARGEAEGLSAVTAAALAELAVGAARGQAVGAAATTLAELDVAEAAARGRVVEAELAQDRLAAELARLAARIERAEHEAGEETAQLELDVTVDAATDVGVTIGYMVAGAAWRPYHRAELARAAGRVEWTTTACLWQATGEDWTDVELTCSLERPSLGVEPPALVDDELRTRRRPEGVVVETRDHEQQTTGQGGGAGGPGQVPGIDDGGLGLTLSAPRATIRKDGQPHRVPVGGFTAPTQLSLVAIPLVSPWVHLRARITNTGQVPILAGPVDLIMSSGYVGRAEVGFVAAGEKFHLGFGPDADLRVHRTETRERDEAGLLGGWNVQTVRVAIRLSNLGAARRELELTERIPVSEVEQVDVQISSPDAYLLGTEDQPGGEDITQVTARAYDERGLVTWGVELPPHGRRAVTLEYRVRSQRGVTGV